MSGFECDSLMKPFVTRCLRVSFAVRAEPALIAAVGLDLMKTRPCGQVAGRPLP